MANLNILFDSFIFHVSSGKAPNDVMNKRNIPVFVVAPSMDARERAQPAWNYLLRKRKLFATDLVPTQIPDTDHKTTPYSIRSDDVYVPRNNRFYKLLVED